MCPTVHADRRNLPSLQVKMKPSDQVIFFLVVPDSFKKDESRLNHSLPVKHQRIGFINVRQAVTIVFSVILLLIGDSKPTFRTAAIFLGWLVSCQIFSLKSMSAVVTEQLCLISTGMIISFHYADGRFRMILLIKQLYHLNFR